ncbi:MAG: YifB family Mg chelatase-like AAA ATPase [Lawsonella sp.]
MALGSAQSVAMQGLSAIPVTIEAATGRGLPTTQLVGKADISVRESVRRLRAAFTHINIPWPRSRITLSLSPADVPKTGAHYDLAIAVAILNAQRISADNTLREAHTAFLGEVGLDGHIVPVTGVLPMVLALRQKGIKRIYVPAANYAEASVVPDIDVAPINHLQDLLQHTPGEQPVPAQTASDNQHGSPAPDFCDIRGQRQAIETALIAAAGGHHLLMLGPPGSGKSMIAARIPSILPRLNFEESLEVTSIHSILGELNPAAPLMTEAPFVAPHPRITAAALLGGGSGFAKPGAISRAHRGVLFLDECTEIKSSTLDLLRTPLQEKEIRLSRSQGTVTYPAHFQLVLAGNSCPCGAPTVAECRCSSSVKERYRQKISGPLLDRIDIRMRLEPPRMGLLSTNSSVDSGTLRDIVATARKRAQKRWGRSVTNAAVDEKTLRKVPLQAQALEPTYPLLRAGMLSARGLQRTIRLAWTIADLNNQQAPGSAEIAEALELRVSLEDL